MPRGDKSSYTDKQKRRAEHRLSPKALPRRAALYRLQRSPGMLALWPSLPRALRAGSARVDACPTAGGLTAGGLGECLRNGCNLDNAGGENRSEKKTHCY